MSAKKVCLVVGLKAVENDPHSPWDAETTAKALEKEVEKAAEAGYDFVPHLIDPHDKNLLQDFRKLLQDRRWDCVSIGFGVRGNPELTPLFSQLVNAAIDDVRPPPKLAFPLSPVAILEAIEMVF